MSAEPTEEQAKNEEFSKQFSNEIELALKGIAEKYKGMLQDFAVIVNWTHENHQKPFPKLVIASMRAPGPDYDPVRQALELGDLLNMGGTHLVRNMMFHFMQESRVAHELLKKYEKADGPKIVVP